MNPIAAYNGYTPTSMALPGMMSMAEQMAMPYFNSWNNYLTQMDIQNSLGIPMSNPVCSSQTAAGQTMQGTGGSIFNIDEHLAQLAAQDQRLQQYQIAQQIQARQNMRAQISPLENMNTAALDLQRKIVHNEQSQIGAALAKYMKAVKDAYYAPDEEVSREDLMVRVRNQYMTDTGQDLIDEIKKNGNPSFAQGFINSLFFGCFGQQSAEKTISEITGQKIDSTEEDFKNAGTVTSVLSWGAAGAAIGGFCGAGVFSPVTAAAGGCIGLVAGAISALVGHNRHNK